MLRLAIILLLSVGFFLPTNGQCLRAHFMFDGNTADSSTYANHGTAFGGTSVYGTDRYGIANSAYYFDGINDYIDTYTTYDYQDRTVSFWFKPTRTSGINVMMTQDDNNLTYGSFHCLVTSGTIQGRAGGNPAIFFNPNTNANWWYYVVLVRTSTTNYFYVNGQLKATSTANGGGSSFGANNDLVFGVNRMRSSNFFQGYLDDVMILNCPLDSNQVDSMYQVQRPVSLVSLPGDTAICAGQSFQINMPNHPRVSYLWDNGSTSRTRTINQAGTYWLQSIAPNDTLVDTLVVSLLEPGRPYQMDTLACSLSNPILVDYTNRGDISSVLWSDGDTSRTRSFTGATNLSVTLNSPCGLVADSIRIQIEPSISPVVQYLSTCATNPILIGPRTNAAYQVLWSTGSSQNQISVSTPGTYWSLVISPCDTVVDSFYVDIPTPLPVFEPDSTFICEMGDSVRIGLAVTDPDHTFSWGDGNPNEFRYVRNSGVYLFTVSNGCALKDYRFEVFTIAEAKPIALPDTSLCEDQFLYFNTLEWPILSTTINGYTIEGESYTIGGQTNRYIVEYEQPCGIWTDTFNIEVSTCDCEIVLANAFSPNGDDLNEFFEIKSACSNFDYDLKIFNRWGGLVFENSAPDDFWDGTFRSQAVPPGVYVYKLYYEATINGQRSEGVKQGTIRVYR